MTGPQNKTPSLLTRIKGWVLRKLGCRCNCERAEPMLPMVVPLDDSDSSRAIDLTYLLPERQTPG